MILDSVGPHVLGAVRIQVISKHSTALFRRRDDERTDSSKDVRDHIRWFEVLDEAVVLGM